MQNLVERFNIEKFDSNKVNGEYNFVTKDGYLVRQLQNSKKEEYSETLKKPQSPFSVYKVYFKKSGLLKVMGEQFYSFPIGVWKYFDESQNLINETNWEREYTFSIKDLEKKMQSMGVNIMVEKKGIVVDRTLYESPFYFVSYPESESNPYDVFELKIDGKTGEIVAKNKLVTRH